MLAHPERSEGGSGQRVEALFDPFVVLLQGRKQGALAAHHPQHVAAALVQGEELVDQPSQPLAARACTPEAFRDLLVRRQGEPAHAQLAACREELVERWEVPVHRRWRDIGPSRDLLPARGQDALRRVEVHRGFHDPPPGLLDGGGAPAHVVRATAADTGGQYTLVEVVAPPSLEAPLHVHRTEDEAFLILEGDVVLYVGDERIEATAGQFAFGPRDVPHRFEVGPAGARMLWVITPAGFENLVEAVSVPAEEMAVPPPEVAPPENAAEIVTRYGNEILG